MRQALTRHHWCRLGPTLPRIFRGYASIPVKPTAVRLEKAHQRLVITWSDGTTSHLSSEYLRTQSPSAEVQGHSRPVPPPYGKSNVQIFAVEAVGNYAIRLLFDDLHDSGIYSWAYLRTLSEEKLPRMRRYIRRLQGMQKSRRLRPRGKPAPQANVTQEGTK